MVMAKRLLDNSSYFADFETERAAPQRRLARQGDAAAQAASPVTLPAVRTRISVRWGDLWFDGPSPLHEFGTYRRPPSHGGVRDGCVAGSGLALVLCTLYCRRDC